MISTYEFCDDNAAMIQWDIILQLVEVVPERL